MADEAAGRAANVAAMAMVAAEAAAGRTRHAVSRREDVAAVAPEAAATAVADAAAEEASFPLARRRILTAR